MNLLRNYFNWRQVSTRLLTSLLLLSHPTLAIPSTSNHSNARLFKSLHHTVMTDAKAVAAYRQLPVGFEANHGHVDPRVKYLARSGSYTLFLTGNEAVLNIPGISTVIRTQLMGINPKAQLAGNNPLPGKSNYFIGANSQQWRTNVAQYGEVKYHQIYPGVDLAFSGAQQQMASQFTVQPGGALDHIRMRYIGVKNIQVNPSGDLMLETTNGNLRLLKPELYQETSSGKQQIDGQYVVNANNEISLAVKAYDLSQPLMVISRLEVNETLLTADRYHSTYLGGKYSEEGQDIAIDQDGFIYVTGYTTSPNFPTTSGVVQPDPRGTSTAQDVFVAKLSNDGATQVYSTYIGGTTSATDVGYGIAVDGDGQAHVTGYAMSADFPTTGPRSATDGAFVLKLSADGSKLLYSRILYGGVGQGIAIDKDGRAYVTGYTNAVYFPTTPGVFQSRLNVDPKDTFREFDAFVTKLNADGSLSYSTYLGSPKEDKGYAIAVDEIGNAYVTGYTVSGDFPTTSYVVQRSHAGIRDAFVTKLNASGLGLHYSTFLGGSKEDEGHGITVDSATGNVYVTGETASRDFPLTAEAAQYSYGGGDRDAFVTQLSRHATSRLYSSFLGGSQIDKGWDIEIDSAKNIYVVGETRSTDFPGTTGAIQPNFGGGGDTPTATDAFAARIHVNSDEFSSILYSTYLGGNRDDKGYGLAVDTLGKAYFTGGTKSANFPVTSGAFQTTFGGLEHDAFVASKLSLCQEMTLLPTSLPDGKAGIPYSNQTLSTMGGLAPVTFAITNGALPPWLRLSIDGKLLASPINQLGAFSFTLTATGKDGCNTSQNYSIETCLDESITTVCIQDEYGNWSSFNLKTGAYKFHHPSTGIYLSGTGKITAGKADEVILNDVNSGYNVSMKFGKCSGDGSAAAWNKSIAGTIWDNNILDNSCGR